MRHKTTNYTVKMKDTTLYLEYSDTYTKPIKEVVEPYGIEYLSLEEVYVKHRYMHLRGWETLSSHINSNYRIVMASDGIFFLPKDCKLSNPSTSPHKPKRYDIAYDTFLAKDALGQPIYGGSIVYYSYMQYRTICHNFSFVRNITEGRGQLVCHPWDRSTKQFSKTTRNISNISECIVVDKQQFLKAKEIEGFFIPEEY